MYLKANVNMIPHKAVAMVGLALYIQGLQGVLQAFVNVPSVPREGSTLLQVTA